MSGITAFGKQVPSSMASAILNAPSLTASPSVANPESAPSSEVAMKYAQLLAIATDLMQLEQDLVRKSTLAENVGFFDRAVRETMTQARSGGAPAPSIQPPPMAPAGPSPAAMGAPNPGAPPSPPPPGAGINPMQGVPQ